MKAIVYERYGTPDVLQLKEVDKPVPGNNEVLIKIHAASINSFDMRHLKADPFLIRFGAGLLKPKKNILGVDIAGVVEAVGKNVTRFQPGDEVFGDICECGCGGFAEYVSVDGTELALKPASMTFNEAASIPMAAVTALKGLRDKGEIKSGQKLLINGASGGVGSFAVQIAKSFGAEVTAVCSTRNLDLARSLGADHVIDYSREDLTKSGKLYDLILACNGYHPLSAYRRALRPEGTYVMAGGTMKQIFAPMLLGPLLSKFGSKKITNISSKPSRGDLEFLIKLFEAGKIRPFIDRSYPLQQTADAFWYIEREHAQGKVVITVC
ncbi:MAG: NAD(P)-dependent alcohol dehydrogenase [Candidatus Zixiibacteriota bacterium]|nr:MAG: NAD(P)-dependent alcohol dehydrogenase [candidate division Zixibacteria bacterium]